jgi:hypothetical protein
LKRWTVKQQPRQQQTGSLYGLGTKHPHEQQYEQWEKFKPLLQHNSPGWDVKLCYTNVGGMKAAACQDLSPHDLISFSETFVYGNRPYSDIPGYTQYVCNRAEGLHGGMQAPNAMVLIAICYFAPHTSPLYEQDVLLADPLSHLFQGIIWKLNNKVMHAWSWVILTPELAGFTLMYSILTRQTMLQPDSLLHLHSVDSSHYGSKPQPAQLL